MAKEYNKQHFNSNIMTIFKMQEVGGDRIRDGIHWKGH